MTLTTLQGRAVAIAAALLLAGTIAGCGGESEHDREKKAEHAMEKAADRNVCVAKATKVSTPEGFPTDFPIPPGAVVYDGQDRGDDGVVVTAVTRQPFKDVLAALNGPAQKAGFKVTEGETEKHDAEANWTGNGYRGRWAIRESGSCPGETVIQVLAAK